MYSAEFVARQPAAAVRSYVDRYVGYRQHGLTQGTHRGLPSHSITMVISLAEEIRLAGGVGAERGPVALHGLVGGLHLRPALIEQDSYQEGLHLYLNPLGARRLLGVSPGELVDNVYDLHDLPVPWARSLIDRLRAAPDWAARFAVLDTELAVGPDRPVTLLGEIQWAWHQLLAHGGAPRVSELAAEVGWSRRHFGARFADAVGVPPKQAARLVRFERSNELLRGGTIGSLSQLAVECGYYDQAHLTNDWRQLAGCSPGTWIAEELPFLTASPEFLE